MHNSLAKLLAHALTQGSISLKLLGLASLFLICSCGVKGDPVPPTTPVELGRGQPTYKRAAEEFAFPDIPPVQEDSEEKEKK